MRKSTYFDARKFTKTVQLLLNASKASLWIDVFGGRTPFANREIIVRGSARSCIIAISVMDTLLTITFLLPHSFLRGLHGQWVQAIPHRHS